MIRVSVLLALLAFPATAAPPEKAGHRLVQIANGPVVLEPPATPSDAPVVFRQVARSTTKGQVANANAGPFDPLRLPATFKAELPGGSCTATLVGPRVLLTAAHCLDPRTPDHKSVLVVPGGIRLDGDSSTRLFRSCELAAAYVAGDVPLSRAPRNAKDWALCELTAAAPGARLETLSLDPAATPPHATILVAGFGCTGLVFANGLLAGTGGADNTLSVGENRLADARRKGWAVATGKLGGMDAIICPGDSGGAAYAGASLTARPPDIGWRVVAVNSAVGPTEAEAQAWRDRPPDDGTPLTGTEFISYFAPLADPEFQTFLAAFQGRSPATRQICGVGGYASGNCRP